MTKNWNEMTRDERLAEVDACWTQVDTREPLPENWTDRDVMECNNLVLYPNHNNQYEASTPSFKEECMSLLMDDEKYQEFITQFRKTNRIYMENQS